MVVFAFVSFETYWLEAVERPVVVLILPAQARLLHHSQDGLEADAELARLLKEEKLP